MVAHGWSEERASLLAAFRRMALACRSMPVATAHGMPFVSGGSARWCNSVTLVAALQCRCRALDAALVLVAAH